MVDNTINATPNSTSGDLGDGWAWIIDKDGDIEALNPQGKYVAHIVGRDNIRAASVMGSEYFFDELSVSHQRRLREVWCELNGWEVTSEPAPGYPHPTVSIHRVGSCMTDVLDEDTDTSDINPSWPEVVRNMAVDMLTRPQ